MDAAERDWGDPAACAKPEGEDEEEEEEEELDTPTNDAEEVVAPPWNRTCSTLICSRFETRWRSNNTEASDADGDSEGDGEGEEEEEAAEDNTASFKPSRSDGEM